jgi:hypothetical protein
MSGCLVISETYDDHAWIVAGWVFRNVLEGVAAGLERHDASRARTLRDATENFHHCDLRHWSRQEFRWFYDAVVEVRRRHADAGPQSFGDPKFFPGFIERMDDLLDLLRRDVRLS